MSLLALPTPVVSTSAPSRAQRVGDPWAQVAQGAQRAQAWAQKAQAWDQQGRSWGASVTSAGRVRRVPTLAALAALAALRRSRRRQSLRSGPIFSPAKVEDSGHWLSVEARDLGDKGFGVVATEPIKRGELVLKEPPLFSLPESFDDLDPLLNQTSLRQLNEDLETALEDLENKQRFWSLADSHSVGQKTAAGIALTNALQLGQGGGLLTRSARFNHSCLPNVQGTWTDGCAEWRALKDLSPGEELCFSYVDPYQTDVQRQETLELLFKFKCRCPICSLEKRRKMKSNKNRLEIQNLKEALQMAAFGNDPGKASKVLVPKILELLDLELEGNPAFKSKILQLGVLLAAESEDEDLAKNMATEAWENAVVAYGPHSEKAQMLRSCAEGDYESEDFEDLLIAMQTDDVSFGRS